MTNLNILYKNIENYLNKFYLFKVLQGVILTLTFTGLLYLILVLLNYFFYFDISLKKILFFTSLLLTVGFLTEFVLLPLARLFKILPRLSYNKASKAIPENIAGIDDKLTNVLELINSKTHEADIGLINASINQKSDDLRVFNFSSAINFKNLKKYIKYLIVPIFLFLFIIVYKTDILLEGTQKFVKYDIYYEKDLPFDFILKNKYLTVQSGKDLELNLLIKGSYSPSNVYVCYGTNKIPLSYVKGDKNAFNYTFKSVNNNFIFYFEADGYKSKNFEIHVLPSPSIHNFNVKVNPPSYTGLQNFTVSNSGDLLVPFGSRLDYTFETSNVDSLFIDIDSIIFKAVKTANDFQFTYTAKKSLFYKINVLNEYFIDNLFKYNLTLIPDLFPNIDVYTAQDSNNTSLFYFKGLITDDYGYSSLAFEYQIVDKTNPVTNNKYQSISLEYSKNLLNQEFYFFYDFNDLDLTSDQSVNYHFIVKDNDYISGYKSATSQKFTFSLKTFEEFDSTLNSLNKNINKDINKAYNLSFEIQNDINDFQKKLLNENMTSWEKDNFLENFLKKQEKLENILDSLKQQNDEKLKEIKNNTKEQDELLKKHEEIQKLIADLLTDDIKDLLKELQELKEKQNIKNFNEQLEKTKFSYDEMSEELDRTKELLNRMELEQNIENLSEQLDNLADEQDKLSEQFKNEKITEEQKDSLLTNEFKFNELMSEYDSLMKKNDELKEPYDLLDFEELQNEINEQMENSKEMMFDDKNKKASEPMKNSSENMKKMSEMMKGMMQQNMMQQNSEDMEAIKFLLSNLLTFSFKQENLNSNTTTKYSVKSEFYQKLKLNQLELNDQFTIISDTLKALANRNPMIGKVITNELSQIKSNLNSTNSLLEQNKRSNASVSQRRTISSINKLALLLSDALNNMQSQMSSSGYGQHQKPNGQKPKPGTGEMKQMQESMQQQLQDMINNMKNGEQPKSSELGQQIAKREAFQKMLENLMNSGEVGKDLKDILQEINQLNDDIKKDILNNNISPELLERDKEIKTRLLQVEKSENQRKFSDKRKSNTGENIEHNNPNEIENYFKEFQLQNESFTKKIINLNNFYKNFYNEYVNRLGQY